MEKSKPTGENRGSNVFLIVVIAVILTALIVGAIVYFWQKYANLKSSLENLQTTTAPAKITSNPTKNGLPLDSPSVVVSQYLKHTLGTIPGADLNENMAKTYLAPALQSQFVDSSFIPLSYGIQEGPESVEIVSEQISGQNAHVTVNGFYGGSIGKTWLFELTIIDQSWKINQITSL